MDWFIDIITNPYLITAFSSWFIAQILKTLIHTIVTKKFEINRIFGDGGMPSGHSATVTSLAVLSALMCGADSFEFAVCVVLATIVCHDAMGVRRETGKQSVVLGEIMKSFEIITSKKMPDVKLKEFVGHSPFQVLFGIILGVLNALFMFFILV